jgi:AraC family transcriptional regulator
MNSYQKEYIHRINRVVDYIDTHMHEELSLERLAAEAAFSPYHFHRIFSAMTGETLSSFINRLRLEKAGSLLINNPDIAISDIAFRCGFGSTAVFCRNFKKRFGQTAQEFREEKQKSKNRQSLRKNRQPDSTRSGYVCDIESINITNMKNAENITIKDMPSLQLVYTRHTGPFYLIGQAYGKLMQWAGPRGLLNNPDLKTVTVYHDDPNVTDLDKVRQSACITVNEKVKTEGEFGYMTLDAAKCVVGRFEILPTEFEPSWNAVCLWLSSSGYQPADAYPYELYHNNHEEHPEGKFIVDICIPVKPL